MKKIKTVLAALLLTAVSTAWAIELSLNQSQFSAGDPLNLTLTNEDWSGEADIYVALTLPADETLYFLTPSGLVLEWLPFQQAQQAKGSREILQIANLAPLPLGQYTFYAGVTVPGTLDIISEIAMISVIFVEKLELGDISFPEGVVGESYSFAIEPESGMPPYQFSLISGSLPNGLTLSESGLIQGTPSERGSAELTVQVTDATGEVAEIEGVLNVFGVVTFGEHGTFKGCNGLQMAFNASQDLDEIRIEQGTYECHGLEIPEGKDWEQGIKISGGWDSSFENQSDDPALTVFDGKEGGRILKVPSGEVTIEGLSFQNGTSDSDGGAIYVDATVNITNCSFSSNSASDEGGAVYFRSSGNITNSRFSNNTASENGGAVYSRSSGNITNSRFSSNRASEDGGAIYFRSSGNITNSIFTNNSASENGGAVWSSGNIINSTLSKNSASNSGGAFYGEGTILNSIFAQNQAGKEANDITPDGELHVDYTLVNNISGVLDLGPHFIMDEPRFVDAENGDFRLRADSPAINVGDSSVIESYPFLKDEAGNEIDLDGNRRIVGEGIDLGAYEYQ
jgi:predicted outer membrane repeat protein